MLSECKPLAPELVERSATSRGTPMSAAPVLQIPRQRDRRQGFADLLDALTRCLDRSKDIGLMRGAFEEMLRRMVPVRALQLREVGSRWAGRLAAAPGVESIALEVRGSDRASSGLLEATFDPGCRLGE